MNTKPKGVSIIFFQDTFSSAHFLPFVPTGHKCGSLHGHNYHIRIEIMGQLTEQGWVCDFADLKDIWCKTKDCLDHKFLNDILPNPTCELLLEWIKQNLAIPGLCRIELYETQNCGAIWQR